MVASTYERNLLSCKLLIASVLIASVLIGLVCGSGCAPLKAPVAPEPRNSFSIARSAMNPGAVAMQLAVVQLDFDQSEMFEAFWGHLDQLKLPLPVRKIADANGLRYAVMSPQVPAVLSDLLESREVDLSTLSDLKRQMAEAGLIKSPSRMVLHQRIENDTGEEYAIPTSDIYPQKQWTISGKDDVELTGVGELVKGIYRYASFPQADGSVRLVMLPEIHHGLPRHRFDVSQRTFLMSESQIETKATPLEFKVDLQPGETLVIAPNGSTGGIGDLLFGHQGLAGTPLSIDQKSDLDQQIEAAVAAIDTSLGSDLGGELGAASAARTPVTPLYRFLMIRLLHTQAENAWSADTSERLTTTNHD